MSENMINTETFIIIVLLYKIDNSASNRPDPAAGSAGNKAPNSPCPSQVGQCQNACPSQVHWNFGIIFNKKDISKYI